MNKKFLFMIFIIFVVIIIAIVLVVANINKKEKINEEAKYSLKTVNFNELQVDIELSDSDKERYIEIGNKCLSNLKITNMTFENPVVQAYKDNRHNRSIVIISDDNMRIELNKETEELVSYMHKNTSFKAINVSEDKAREIALQIFSSFNISGEYEISELSQFDEELYLVKFFKKYGEYTNPGERINFSFSTETEEVVSFARESIPYANNEVKISKTDAANIALPYLEGNTLEDITIELKIVVPGSGALPSPGIGYVYASPTQTRLAYECTSKDKTTIVDIDCTTGEVLELDNVRIPIEL